MPGTQNLSATNPTDVLIKAEAIFRDPAFKAKYKRKPHTLMAISENQTLRFAPKIYDAEQQCFVHKATWVEGEATFSDQIGDCELPESTFAHSKTKNYNVGRFFKSNFSVDEANCNTVTFEELFAEQMMIALNGIRDHINKAAIEFLNAQAATENDYAAGTFSGNEKTYPTALWANLADIIYKLDSEAEFNDITMPVIVSGENLNQAAWTAMYKGTNGCCVNDKAVLDSLGVFHWDRRNLDQRLSQAATFMFDANRVGILNAWESDNDNPVLFDASKNAYKFGFDDMDLFVKNGNTSRPIRYDVFVQDKCYVDGAGIRRKRYTYEVSVRWEFVLSPSVDASKTGILKFINA